MENYRGESTLTSWLKSVCLFYCYRKFKKQEKNNGVSANHLSIDENSLSGDRLMREFGSYELESDKMNLMDLETLISLMPNERYRKIIRLRYIEHMSNEETAELMGMTMANFYNKHKLAKAQFLSVSRKEALYG